MSNLLKNYEISVWEENMGPNGFTETRLGVIGSHIMQEMGVQCRVLEPTLIQKTNGEKKLQFSLYKQYIDNISGEKVDNPFYGWLINERKVKLFCENKWYDFIIKNIVENSSNYLYTYQLEDAYVQELSKNGFNVALDVELNNNLGTAKELGEYVLQTTDWTVQSEALVEQIEDNLVYIQIPQGVQVYQCLDQKLENMAVGVTIVNNPTVGKVVNGITVEPIEVLAFYSSCKTKPHRFQFIYIPEGYAKHLIQIDESQNILNSDCHFFCEFNTPSKDYVLESQYSCYLPKEWSISIQSNSSIETLNDSTISNWYKGKRYGFTQLTTYIPQLKKYCNHFLKDDELYYGYLDTHYITPTFLTNAITSADFTSLAGWTGTYINRSTNSMRKEYEVQVENVTGHFDNENFVSVVELLRSGNYNSEEEYTNYLKVIFPQSGSLYQPLLLNSGFYDQRMQIKTINLNDQWVFEIEARGKDNTNLDFFEKFKITLGEVQYIPSLGSYSIIGEIGEAVPLEASGNKAQMGIIELKSLTDDYTFPNTEEEFCKRNIRLIITPKNSEETEVYIEKIALYKRYINDEGELIKPLMESNDTIDVEGKIENETVLVKAADLVNFSSLENLAKINIKEEELDYATFYPVYKEGAERVRTVSEKESNYFNILQSIAEGFEAWMDIQIEHNDQGQVTNKIIRFKNYAGKDNYASIRYGVNLKDIQRTYESKKMVSKLIVKQNANEMAPDGFCTIARAKANPTGENYIYDFRYYFKRDLMNEIDYLAQVYYEINPYTSISQQGQDLSSSPLNWKELDKNSNWNIQNYYNRIANLNNTYSTLATQISQKEMELIELEANKKIQEGLISAATDSIEESSNNFYAVSGGYEPEKYGNEILKEGSCVEYKRANNNPLDPEQNAQFFKQNNGTGIDYEFKVVKKDESKSNESLTLYYVGQGGDFLSEEKTKENVYTISYYHDLGFEIQFSPSHQKQWYHISFIIHSPNSSYPVSHYFSDIDLVGKDNTFADITIGDFSMPDWSGKHYFYSRYGNEVPVSFYVRGLEEVEILMHYAKGMNSIQIVKITDLKVAPMITYSYNRNFFVDASFVYTTQNRITQEETTGVSKQELITCVIPPYEYEGTAQYSLSTIPPNGNELDKILSEYAIYQAQLQKATKELDIIQKRIDEIKKQDGELSEQKTKLELVLDYKNYLNNLFYQSYSRFIQEGTWIDENYVDDEKYYTDALSVSYNSCYPQVSYNINTMAVNTIPGYELFTFELGDKVQVVDEDFFGTPEGVEVVIMEVQENLENPNKNQFKVQNFKNAFEDLFQKITATVQQTQYSTGSYQRAAELAEGNTEITQKFLTDALSKMEEFALPGQTTIDYTDGILLTNQSTQNQLKLVGGGILLGVVDKEGRRKWKTGLTPNGISASLITAGSIDTNNITIKSGNEETFKWNAFGLTAFDIDWNNGQISGTANPFKFVRFDKYGLYGISQNSSSPVADGRIWKPDNIENIMELASFALTWDGLKIKTDSVETLIGHNEKKIIDIVKTNQNGTKDNVLSITEDGDLEISGVITAKAGGTIGGWTIGDNCLVTSKHSLGTSDSFHLYSSGNTDSVAFGNSGNKTNWRLGIGTNLGIDKDGNLYATNADLSGKITATGGSIEGILTVSEKGGIGVDTSECKWRTSGIIMGAGNVGCWSVSTLGTAPIDRALKASGVFAKAEQDIKYSRGFVILDNQYLIYEVRDVDTNTMKQKFRIHWADAILYLVEHAHEYFKDHAQGNYSGPSYNPTAYPDEY